MDIEDVMLEEHLLDEELLTASTATVPTSTTIATISISQKQQVGRRKLLVLLAMHLQNFQRALLNSRRQCQQRIRRRQGMLRAFYMQQLLEIETSFMEMLPVPGMSELSATPNEQVNGNDTEGEVVEQEPTTTESADNNLRLRFYEDAVSSFSEEQWLATFRMSRRTFQWLCTQVRQVMQPQGVNSPHKNLISLEKRVALSLYGFATGEDYRAIAALFGISRPSVCKFIKRFAETVFELLGNRLLTLPKRQQDYHAISNAFHQASNMPPLVVGVLGICKLPVSPFADDGQVTNNNDTGPTIILQALIDNRLLFRHVQVESKRPTLFQEAPNEITKLGTQLINEREMPSFVVTAASLNYPLRPWLMHQYEEPVVPHEYDFNEAVDNLLTFQEHAFRRLFARWRILQRKTDLGPRTMESIAMACCTLHNLLEEREEGFLELWAEGIDVSKLGGNFTNAGGASDATEEAVEMRDFLARTISSTEM